MSSAFFLSRNTLGALVVSIVGLTSSACGVQNADLSDARVSFRDDANVVVVDAAIVTGDAAAPAIDGHVTPVDAAPAPPIDAGGVTTVDAAIAHPIDARVATIDAPITNPNNPPDAAAATIDGQSVNPNNPPDAAGTTIDGPITNPNNPPDAAVATVDAAPPAPDANSGPFAGGSGALDDPYIITNVAQLLDVNDINYQSSSFRLAVDLDLSGVAMEPIGLSNDQSNFTFAGTFDGNHHRISNWTATSANSCVGLFSQLSGMVSDVVLVTPNVTGTNSSTVGGIVGCDQGGRIIRDQVVGGQITSDMFAAGIVGSQDDQQLAAGVANCFSSASISAQYAAGLVVDSSGYVADSYSTGAVAGSQYAGGLITFDEDTNTTARTYASGAVTGGQQAGGLVASIGRSGAAATVDSFWDSDDTLPSTSAAGSALTAEQTLDPSNFTDWDFANTWSSADGAAPTLRALGNVAPMTAVTQYVDTGASGPVPFAFRLSAYDFNGDALTFTIIQQPTLGTLSQLNGNALTYTPSGWNGFSDTLTYQVTDSDGAASPVSTVTITGEPGCNPAEPGFADGGDGSSGNPYNIATLAELQLVHQYVACDYVLSSDIDLAGVDFSPIGSGYPNVFGGSFDGKGHVIKNWTYTSTDSSEQVGFFGDLNWGASVSNLGLENVNLSGAGNVGGITATDNGGRLTRDHVSGTVTGGQYVGGLVGTGEAAYIDTCFNAANVSGGNQTGGIIGLSGDGQVVHSYSTGNVTGNFWVGGIVGWIIDAGVSTSYSTGSVSGATGQEYVGGLVGYRESDNYSLSDSYSTAAISTGNYCGGLIGYDEGQFLQYGERDQRVYATGAVTNCATRGGLIGTQQDAGTLVVNGYWDVDTTGLATSAGSGSTGEPDDAMLLQSTYVGFDFTNVWFMPDSGYPQLR